jgi:hypothetical protein
MRLLSPLFFGPVIYTMFWSYESNMLSAAIFCLNKITITRQFLELPILPLACKF